MNNQTIDELRNRKLDNFYFLIMVFQTKINLNEGNGIKKNEYVYFLWLQFTRAQKIS